MHLEGSIVVGLGSLKGPAVPALDWAANEAQARGARLTVIRAYYVAGSGDPRVAALDHQMLKDLRRDAELHLADGLDRLRQRWPDLPVSCRAVQGERTHVLAEASRSALLTVVGGRRTGRGRFTLGRSVGELLAATGCGPVIVVGRREVPPVERPAVVAGLDGGPDSDQILGFAFERASWHKRMVRIVFSPGEQRDDGGASLRSARERTQSWLSTCLAGWEQRYPQVEVQLQIVANWPATAFAQASVGQDLLVIGDRARHVWPATLLGSLNRTLLRHASCPIAIVHPALQPGTQGARGTHR